MQSHDVIREAIDKVGPKQVAAEIGVSLSLVYKWSQPNTETGSGSRNPLDRVAQLSEITDDIRIVEWLCKQFGGYFVPNPDELKGDDYDVMPATNEIVHQFAGLLQTISQAALDKVITNKESEDIRKVWDRLKSYTEGFVRCCEKGDFRPLNRERLSKKITDPS